MDVLALMMTFKFRVGGVVVVVIFDEKITDDECRTLYPRRQVQSHISAPAAYGMIWSPYLAAALFERRES